MQQIVKYFIRGLIISLPIALSLYAVLWLFSKIDSLLNLTKIFQELPDSFNPFNGIYIPGLGLLFAFGIVALVGFLTSHIVNPQLQKWFDKLLNRIPLFRFFYSSTKDITEAFVGDDKKFSEPVLVTVNNAEVKRIGFVTQKDLNFLGLEDYVSVYFPMSYSIAGNVYIVKKDCVQYLNISSADAMRFVVSGGVIDIEEEV